MFHSEPHFLSFIHTLEGIKARHGDNSVEVQEWQVNDLMAAEKEFRKALVRHPWGAGVYRDFVKFIVETKHNVLIAQPYFRERDTTFNTGVSQALRRGLVRSLYRFHFNFLFISWVLKQRAWKGNRKGRKLLELADRCRTARATIIEANLPLAISQARVFFEHNRHGHQSFMDMVQVAAGGLSAGVDKFVGPYTKTFRSVLIGRILGDLIKANSETFVHFFPADKRRIYRVRKIVSSLRDVASDVDYGEVVRLLNLKEQKEGEEKTTVEELHHLMSAASVASASSLNHSGNGEESAPDPIENYPADAELRPDNLVEEADARRALSAAVKRLPLFYQKLLKLRGVDLESL